MKKNYSYKVLRKKENNVNHVHALVRGHTHTNLCIFKFVTAEPQTTCRRVKTTHNQMCHCKTRILGYIL